jgi:[acyl-carrier-protein] S-malonyltransferase
MGRDLAASSPAAAAVFAAADRALGEPISTLAWEGPAEQLDRTENAQPALVAASIAMLASLRAAWASGGHAGPTPRFAAGHSMGQYSALVAAGAISLEDGVRLVRERGRVMKDAGTAHPGAMAAIIGMEDAALEDVCRQASARHAGLNVVCANYNSPGQVVISGDAVAMETAIALAKERGARRAIPLAVTIASHSPLMKEAAAEYARTVGSAPVQAPQTPVVANVSALPLSSAHEIRNEMLTQLTSPVRWTASVQYMISQGVTSFIEVGPKDVLSGLIKRIDPAVPAISVGDLAGLERLTGGGSNA